MIKLLLSFLLLLTILSCREIPGKLVVYNSFVIETDQGKVLFDRGVTSLFVRPSMSKNVLLELDVRGQKIKITKQPRFKIPTSGHIFLPSTSIDQPFSIDLVQEKSEKVVRSFKREDRCRERSSSRLDFSYQTVNITIVEERRLIHARLLGTDGQLLADLVAESINRRQDRETLSHCF